MSFEKPPSESSFSAEEQEIVDTLKQGGIERFTAWVAEQEKSADAAGIPRANIECNLKIARVQFAGGFAEAARDTLESVRMMANQEGETDLLAQADSILDQMNAAG